MLRCGPSVFAGNAGYRLPLPAGFPAGLPLGEQPAEGQWQHRAEVQIARKLQRIADQFHRLHMQQVGMGDFWLGGGGGASAGAGGLGPASAALSLPGPKDKVPEFWPHAIVILVDWMGLTG